MSPWKHQTQDRKRPRFAGSSGRTVSAQEVGLAADTDTPPVRRLEEQTFLLTVLRPAAKTRARQVRVW